MAVVKRVCCWVSLWIPVNRCLYHKTSLACSLAGRYSRKSKDQMDHGEWTTFLPLKVTLCSRDCEGEACTAAVFVVSDLWIQRTVSRIVSLALIPGYIFMKLWCVHPLQYPGVMEFKWPSVVLARRIQVTGISFLYKLTLPPCNSRHHIGKASPIFGGEHGCLIRMG